MRLNGRKAILGYLGKLPHSTRAERGVLLRYGQAIRIMYPCIPRGGRGYWVRSEDLDAVDKELYPTAWEAIGKGKLVSDVATRRAIMENAKLRRGWMR